MCTETGIKDVYQGVQGACPRRAVTHAGGTAERSERRAVGMGLKLVVTDVTPLSDPLLRFQTRRHPHLCLCLPFFSSRTRRPITQRRAGIKDKGPRLSYHQASECCADDHWHPIHTCDVGCLHSETAADVGVWTCLWPLDPHPPHLSVIRYAT